MERGRGGAASGCVLLPSSRSATLLSISGFDRWAAAPDCRSYAGRDGDLKACWLHLRPTEREKRSWMEEQTGARYRCHQQRLRSLRHSTWTVKWTSLSGEVLRRCGRYKRRTGPIAFQGNVAEEILKTLGGDPSHRNASPVPDRLTKLWQDL